MPSTVGVLFASGDVLMRPLGGRWWPKPGLAAWLASHFRARSTPAGNEAAGDLGTALAAGMEFLVVHHDVPDEAAPVPGHGARAAAAVGGRCCSSMTTRRTWRRRGTPG